MSKGDSSNTKQATWMAVGSLFSYGFGIISSMILSRYFDKADYGTYKQVLYVYNTLLTVFTLGLPQAYSFFIPRVSSDQAKSMIRKITKIFFVLGLLFSLTLFFGSGCIASILKNDDLSNALKIFSLVPLLMLPTMGLEGILATFKKTKFMAFYTISTRIVKLVFVAVPVIFFSGGYIEALIGFVLADAIAFGLALYLKDMPVRNYGYEPCGVSYKEIFAFSLPLLYASLCGLIINSADQFFISRFFGNEVFAEFSNGFIDMPFVGMVVSACSVVLAPIFSRMNHDNLDPKNEIFPIWKSCLRKTSLIIYPLIVFCMFFADHIMIFLYSDKYEVSDSYFRIRLILNFFKVIAYAPLIINIGKVKLYANVHLFIAFLIVVLEYLSVLITNSPYVVSLASVFCHILIIAIFLVFIARFFNVSFWDLFPLKELFMLILSSSVVAIVVRMGLSYWEINNLLKLCLEAASFGVVFLVISYFFKFDYISIIKSLVKK